MNDHIQEIVDNVPLVDLSESELQTIRTHAATCGECDRAFAAARIAALLMKERASEAVENSLSANPFFHTRVLAAWREQQSGGVSAFRRLWSATGALVASMVATTAALAVLTFAVPSAEATDQQTATLIPNSAEAVVLEQSQDNNQITNDQVLSTIYVENDESK